MSHQIKFTLGRSIDITYLTNQLILGISTLAFFISLGFNLYEGDLYVESFFTSIFFALIVFLCWALAREMYPQAEYAALAAALICIGAVVWLGVVPQTILLLGWFVLVLRFLNQSTGRHATLLDRSILFCLTVLNVVVFSWILFWMLSFVFAVQYFFSNKQRDLGFLIISFCVGIGALIFQGIRHNRDELNLVSLLGVVLLFVLLFILLYKQRSHRILADNSQKILLPQRIISAQLVGGMLSIMLLAWFGNYGFLLLIPVWCVIICALVFSLFQLTKITGIKAKQ